ncbi:MAG: hypothetical protein EOM13_00165 [Clostridia bacterium]|nr:phosphotransferase [Eubacteriales bacterium]NCC47456.1 hypothetical protein [Clostridia bacterium]
MSNPDNDRLLSELLADEGGWRLIELPSDRDDHRSCYVETHSGRLYCLRWFPDSSIDRSGASYQRLQFLFQRFACVPQPVRHGLSADRQFQYLLSRWIRGEPVRRRLGQYGPQDDYASGIDYGLVLRQLHAADRLIPHQIQMPPPACGSSDWSRQTADLLTRAERCGLALPVPDRMISLIRSLAKIWTRHGTAWLHGRPGPEHGVLTPRSGLVLTGVTGRVTGHPYRDLAALVLNTGASGSVFLTGVLDSYFAGAAGSRSYQILRLFIAIEILWRIERWRAASPTRTEQQGLLQMIASYQNFRELIPTWYQPLPDFGVKEATSWRYQPGDRFKGGAV